MNAYSITRENAVRDLTAMGHVLNLITDRGGVSLETREALQEIVDQISEQLPKPVCIAPDHLSWKTPQENAADRLRDDTHRRGSRTVGSKLTEEVVKAIRLAHANGASQRQLARQYAISSSHIYRIVSRKVWAWLA